MSEREKKEGKAFTLDDEPECEGLYEQTVVQLLKKKGYNVDDRQFRKSSAYESWQIDAEILRRDALALLHYVRPTGIHGARPRRDTNRVAAVRSGEPRALYGSEVWVVKEAGRV